MLEIRKLHFDDCETLVRLIQQFAEEKGQLEHVTVSAEQLQEDGFGSNPAFEAHLAFIDDALVGFSLYHQLYSGWKGRRSIYLEDLYILPEYRNLGYGKMFLHFLARIAYQQNASLVWEVEREDFVKRHFYFKLGSQDRPNKVGFYLEGHGLENFVQHAFEKEGF